MTDRLHAQLIAAGIHPDLADEITERAAIYEHDAKQTRWKSGIEAQRDYLTAPLFFNHDI